MLISLSFIEKLQKIINKLQQLTSCNNLVTGVES